MSHSDNPRAVVNRIFAALGGVSKVAAALPAPVQTVHSWKSKGSIPLWRRASILDLARRAEQAIDSEALVYLLARSTPTPATGAALATTA